MVQSSVLLKWKMLAGAVILLLFVIVVVVALLLEQRTTTTMSNNNAAVVVVGNVGSDDSDGRNTISRSRRHRRHLSAALDPKSVHHKDRPVVRTSSSSTTEEFVIDDESKAYCARIMNKETSDIDSSSSSSSKDTTGSQFGQDAFLYHNFFSSSDNSHNKNRIYLDIGANHPSELSNSYFFDRCLGWTGICMEPNPQYFSTWRNNNNMDTTNSRRTCTHVPKCAWKEAHTFTFEGQSTGGAISKNQESDDSSTGSSTGTSEKSSSSSWKADCVSIASILDEYKLKTVDLISLDIEGAEIETLSTFPFHQYDVKVWIVETFWLDHREIDFLFTKNGYYKAAQLAIDSVYVKQPNNLWFSDNMLGDYWESNQKFRKRVVKCDYKVGG